MEKGRNNREKKRGENELREGKGEKGERARSKAREEDRKALESIRSMVEHPLAEFSWPIGNRTRGPSRRERTHAAATAVAIFHRPSRVPDLSLCAQVRTRIFV